MNTDPDIISGKICPYCGRKTRLADSSCIYGKSYGDILFCKRCNAYVGVNKRTGKSLGRLANRQLREAKKEAHKYFDQLWQTGIINRFTKYSSGTSKRTKAYMWLSKQLGIEQKYCHIGMMDITYCKMVIELSKEKLEEYGYGQAD